MKNKHPIMSDSVDFINTSSVYFQAAKIIFFSQ